MERKELENREELVTLMNQEEVRLVLYLEPNRHLEVEFHEKAELKGRWNWWIYILDKHSFFWLNSLFISHYCTFLNIASHFDLSFRVQWIVSEILIIRFHSLKRLKLFRALNTV